MGYIIKPQAKNPMLIRGICTDLNRALKRDGRFTAEVENQGVTVRLVRVRLTEAKPYCGQHAGPFLIDRPRKSMKYLEGDDWIAFTGLVNDVLDARQVEADAWSTPMEALTKGRKLWVRRGATRRLRYDFDWQTFHGRQEAVWNHGSPDQFEAQEVEAVA